MNERLQQDVSWLKQQIAYHKGQIANIIKGGGWKLGKLDEWEVEGHEKEISRIQKELDSMQQVRDA